MEELLISGQAQVVISYLAVVAIQKLKRLERASWIDQGTKRLNRWLGIAVALGSSTGFTFAREGDLWNGGVITLSYPPLQTVIEFAIRAGAGYVMQQISYHGVVKQQLPAPAPQPKA